MNPNELIGLLQYNFKTITKQANGISDEQANQQAGQGSNLNWVVGHVLASRAQLLEMLKQSVAGLDAKQLAAIYGTKTKPDAATALPLSQLLQLLEASQAPIEAGLQAADLSPIVESPFGPKTLGDLVNFFVWHEGYHAGQTVIFRHLALD